MTTSQPDPIPTLRQQLSQGGYAALLTDHCQLVEQFENLVVVVIQLWEMNNTLREALTLHGKPLLGRPLPQKPLPTAASLAGAARIAALLPCDQSVVEDKGTVESGASDADCTIASLDNITNLLY